VNKEQRQADFLAKAKDAEEKAARAPAEREIWLKNCASYRELARTT
jgi:hypothetical protein